MQDLVSTDLRDILNGLLKELRHIRMNRSAPATHIWFVDMPDYFFETQWIEGLGRFIKASEITTIWGVPFGQRQPTRNVPQGIWIEDRDGIFHRTH